MKKQRDDKKDIENLNWVSWILIVIAVVLVVISLVPFWINDQPVSEFMQTEPMGDNVSDLINPLISVASVAMMFLAFYMQYRANKLVIKQFERTQFENRFFELLKMHKENSRTVLSSFYAFREITNDNDPLKVNGRRRIEYIVTGINDAYNERIQALGDAKYNAREVFNRVWSSRWEDSYGHYFRHLFMLVRFVITKKFLSYEEKRSYLRIVRASLGNYEQVFLYYDWLSGDGAKWENGDNRYFTDYRMIHNIDPRMALTEFDIREMSPFKEMIASEEYMKEPDRTDDTLFEFETHTSGRL